MKQFFFDSRPARVATTILLMSVFAGIILPVIDAEAAREAGRPAAVWSICWVVVGIFSLYALWRINKKRVAAKPPAIFDRT